MAAIKRRRSFETDLVRKQRGAAYVQRSGLEPDDPALQFALGFIGACGSGSTAQTYGHRLGIWLRWCRERGIRPLEASRMDARTFMADLKARGWAPKSYTAACYSLAAFYHEAVAEDEAVRNPFHRLMRASAVVRDPTPALTLEELELALSAIQRSLDGGGTLVDRRDFTMMFVMARMGPRRIDVFHSCWKDLLKIGGAWRWRLVKSKGDHPQELLLADDVVAEFQAWRHSLAIALGRAVRPEDAIFPSLGSRGDWVHRTDEGFAAPLAPYSISQRIRARLLDVGLEGPRYSSHAMRATSATLAHEHGASIEEVQDQLGHASPAQTQVYIRRSVARPVAASRWSLHLGGEVTDHESGNAAA